MKIEWFMCLKLVMPILQMGYKTSRLYIPPNIS